MASNELERHNLAISIGGIGPTTISDNTPGSERLGYVWTSGNKLKGGDSDTVGIENDGDTDGLYTLKAPDMDAGNDATLRPNELVVDQIGGVGDSIDVFEASISFSAFDFTVRGNTFNVELFRSAERNPSFEIDEGVTKSEGRITTTATSGELENTAAWVRDETIFFKTHNPNNDTPGEYDVERGFYLSPQQHHLTGTKIFTSIPYWDKRKVRFYTYKYEEDSNGNIPLTRRYVGVIDGSTQHDHNRIIVPTTASGAQIRNVKVNRNALRKSNLAADGTDFQSKQFAAPTTPTIDEQYQIRGELQFDSLDEDGESKVLKQNSYTDGDDITTWLQFIGEDGNVIYPYDGELRGILNNLTTIGLGGSQRDAQFLPFGQDITDPPKTVDQVREPLIVQRIYDNKELVTTTYSHTRDVTQFSGHDTKYIYHPVSIVACLLMSTYDPNVDAENFDVLHGNWGSGAYSLLSDSFPDDVRTLVEENPGDQVDQVVLGLGGEDVNVWEACTSLLLQYDYYWTVETNGRLSIKPIRNSDIKFWSEAQDNVVSPVESSTLMVDDGRDEVLDTIEGRIGNVEGFVKPKPLQVQIRQNDPNLSSKLSRNVDQTIEYDSIARFNDAKAERRLTNRGFLQNYKMPRFQFQVDDHLNLDSSLTADYSLGAPVSIEQIPLAKKWISRNGVQKRIDKNNVEFAGRIIARTYLPQKRAYNLTIEIIGLGLARYRAPSGVVKSIDEVNNKIELEDSDDGGTEKLDGGTFFTPGDEIQIFTEDGKKVDSNIQEIQSISDDTLTLDGFAYSTNPSPGDIVELSHFDTDNSETGYENTSVLANIDRAYVALADTNSTIGDADEDADIYGAR